MTEIPSRGMKWWSNRLFSSPSLGCTRNGLDGSYELKGDKRTVKVFQPALHEDWYIDRLAVNGRNFVQKLSVIRREGRGGEGGRADPPPCPRLADRPDANRDERCATTFRTTEC